MKRLDVEGLYPANDFGTKQPIRNVRYHVRLQGKGGNRTRAQLRPGLRPTADIIPDQHIGGRSIGLVRSYRYPRVDLNPNNKYTLWLSASALGPARFKIFVAQ